MDKCPYCGGPLEHEKQYYESNGAIQEIETTNLICVKCKKVYPPKEKQKDFVGTDGQLKQDRST